MSWLDKQHQKIQRERLIRQAMATREYQEASRKQMEQAALRGLAQFCFIGLIWLEMNFRCKKKGMLKFLEFVKKTVEEIGNDTDFLKDSNKYYIEDYGIDVMRFLGMTFEEE